MAERTHTVTGRSTFSVIASMPNISLVLIEIDEAHGHLDAREQRALRSLAEAGVELAYVWGGGSLGERSEDGGPASAPAAASALTAASTSAAVSAPSTASAPPVEGTPSAPYAEPTAPTEPFSHAIDLAGGHPSPTAQLVTLCRELSIAPHQAALIATMPASKDIALKVGTLLALKGSGYQNEAAADRVFAPRHAGGLADALEYVRRLIAAARGQRIR